MDIRDVIHGAISVDRTELPIVDSRHFQRLRYIRQMGFSEHSFPSATHTRYIHSLGAMETSSQAFHSIFKDWIRPNKSSPGLLQSAKNPPQSYQRFRACVRLAALLHDIGHGPLSHTTEFAMPALKSLQLPGTVPIPSSQKTRQATHEDYTLKIILDSELTPHLERAGRAHGFGPLHIAALINSDIKLNDDFFFESLRGKNINFRPVLQQIISSELDADRMDYLRRDSYFSGVSYGEFDFDWISSNLTTYIHNDTAYLAIQHRALYSFEDFLISRFHMFLMVYFHHKSIVYDELLRCYLQSPQCEYELPSDIEAYLECHDNHLHSHLSQSPNEWARRIVEMRPFRLLVELHSGIPSTKAAQSQQEKLFLKMQKDLQRKEVPMLVSQSTGELSKYFGRPGIPIYVRYDNHFSRPEFIPLEKCTDLFERYQKNRSISRIYVSPEDYPKLKNLGRGEKIWDSSENSL